MKKKVLMKEKVLTLAHRTIAGPKHAIPPVRGAARPRNFPGYDVAENMNADRDGRFGRRRAELSISRVRLESSSQRFRSASTTAPSDRSLLAGRRRYPEMCARSKWRELAVPA